MLRISCVAAQLAASQEGLSSMSECHLLEFYANYVAKENSERNFLYILRSRCIFVNLK
jgi:hypothetical protein